VGFDDLSSVQPKSLPVAKINAKRVEEREEKKCANVRPAGEGIPTGKKTRRSSGLLKHLRNLRYGELSCNLPRLDLEDL